MNSSELEKKLKPQTFTFAHENVTSEEYDVSLSLALESSSEEVSHALYLGCLSDFKPFN